MLWSKADHCMKFLIMYGVHKWIDVLMRWFSLAILSTMSMFKKRAEGLCKI
jgi:hypothetical protein